MNDFTAIAAKIKAMRQSLRVPEAVEETAYASAEDLLADLASQPAYQAGFEGLDGSKPRRDQVEHAIAKRPIRDFLKLYRFASLKQRQALKAYGMPFEVDWLKAAFQTVESRHTVPFKPSPFTDYLDRHRKFKVSDLLMAGEVEDLVESLAQTDYGAFFAAHPDLVSGHRYDHFALNSSLDAFAREGQMKGFEKALSAKELDVYLKVKQVKSDLTDIMVLYRARFIYQMPANQLSAFHFGGTSRRQSKRLGQLAQAADEAAFWDRVRTMGYGPAFDGAEAGQSILLQEERYVSDLEHRLARRMGLSMVLVFDYLDDCQEESRAYIRRYEQLSFGRPASSQSRKEHEAL